MLISKLHNAIDTFTRRERFQYSEIEVEVLLISVKPNLKSVDVNFLFTGLAMDNGLEYGCSDEIEFTIDLNQPDIYFEVIRQIEQLDKGVLYRGINLEAHIHVPVKDDIIMLGDGAKDGTVPSFTELFVKKSKSYYTGKITIDFELSVPSNKAFDYDSVKKMFKEGNIDCNDMNVQWTNVIRN